VIPNRSGVPRVRLEQVRLGSDPLRPLLTRDLVEVVAQRLPHRMPARPPHAPADVEPALVPPAHSPGSASFTEPPPPLLLLRPHLALCQQRVVNGRGLRAAVRPSRYAPLVVVVLVVQPAQRMAQLVRWDESRHGVAARSRR